MADPLSLIIGVVGMAMQMLFAPKQKDQFGPRLSDINVASVNPGNKINNVWGTMKLPGQLLWVSPLIENEVTESAQAGGKGGKGGGKGGKGGGGKKGGGGGKKGGGATITTYTYSVDLAVGICAGPVHKVRRIRANQKILWNHPDLEARSEEDFEAAYRSEGTRLLEHDVIYEEAHVGAFFFAWNNYSKAEYDLDTEQKAIDYIMSHPLEEGREPNRANITQLIGMMLDPISEDMEYESYKTRFDKLEIYLGHEDQLPNATIEGYKGVGNVSGYRGLAYFVLTNLALEDFGNSVPTFHVEVEKEDGTVYLHEIIADICDMAGMDKSQYNVDCGMEQVPVHGFAVTEVKSARDILNDLRAVFPFEGQETSYVLRFMWGERKPRAIFRHQDLGAHMQGENRPPTEAVTMLMDYDLPERINLTFQEPERNYSTNTVFAKREITESNKVEEIKLSMAMTRQEARGRVEMAMSNRVQARRFYKWVLPRKYVIMEPGDPILIDEPGLEDVYRQLLITEVGVGANGLIEMTLIDHHFSRYLPGEEYDEESEYDDDKTSITSQTTAYLKDLPLLTDLEDPNQPGFYAILTGSRPGWRSGALLFDTATGNSIEVFGQVIEDGGATGSNWVLVSAHTGQVPHGFVLSALGPADHGVFDWHNEIVVRLRNPDMQLSTFSPSDLLRGEANLALIGDELIQYAEAEELGEGTWRLRGLLRGLRGTDPQITRHAPGDTFVRIQGSSTQFIPHKVEFLFREGKYKAITDAKSAENAPEFTFTNTGNNLRPYTVHLHDAVKADRDFRLRWSPRVRQNGAWQGIEPITIDQPFERYEIDVMSGTVKVRTAIVEDATEWTYTEAMQVADFGSARDSVHLQVYQIGNIIGRGFPLNVTI